MTTPHPTPEERYEAAVNVATKNWLDHCQLCEHENQQNVESLLHMLQIESVAAIRDAEAAGEARGRAMERKEITVRARRLRKRFGKCEGSFREEIIWGHGLRIEKMIRARTDKENSDD